MQKFGWVKDSLDWVIRLQGAYTILAALVAGGLGTLVRAALRYFTNLPALWITPIWLFAAAILLLILVVWGSKLGTFVNYPDFDLQITALLWTYTPDPEPGKTNFYLGARLLNRGAPSISQSWSAKYIIGETAEEMTGYYLVGPSVLNVGTERLTIANEDLLNVKTSEKAVERGGAIYGRLLFTLPGNRDAQIKALQMRIEVTVQDYTSRKYTAVYLPSPKPSLRLLRHPLEKGEFIQVPEAEAKTTPIEGAT